MVNVDVSPSVVLGVGLIGAGVSLWQIRRVKPWISKDYDVVVSCVSLLVGGILIFQGWRLDPLLLFGQLMTTGAAVSFAIEALRLRSEQYEREEKAELQGVLRRKADGSGASAFQLPPPEASQQWAPPPPGAQQQPAGAYDYAQVEQQGGASSSGYGYDTYGQQAEQQWDYGGGAYQPAQYVVPPADGGAAAGFYGGGGGAGQPPSEFTFPASYADPAAGDGGSWGVEAPPPPPGPAPQQPQPPAAGGSSKPYDGMDDW